MSTKVSIIIQTCKIIIYTVQNFMTIIIISSIKVIQAARSLPPSSIRDTRIFWEIRIAVKNVLSFSTKHTKLV